MSYGHGKLAKSKKFKMVPYFQSNRVSVSVLFPLHFFGDRVRTPPSKKKYNFGSRVQNVASFQVLLSCKRTPKRKF